MTLGRLLHVEKVVFTISDYYYKVSITFDSKNSGQGRGQDLILYNYPFIELIHHLSFNSKYTLVKVGFNGRLK